MNINVIFMNINEINRVYMYSITRKYEYLFWFLAYFTKIFSQTKG